MGKTSTGRAMCASIEMYVEDVDATYKPILHAAGAATSLPGGRTLGSGERTKDAFGNAWWVATYKTQQHSPRRYFPDHGRNLLRAPGAAPSEK